MPERKSRAMKRAESAKLLGVPPETTDERTLKRAYHSAALLCHPDKCGTAHDLDKEEAEVGLRRPCAGCGGARAAPRRRRHAFSPLFFFRLPSPARARARRASSRRWATRTTT